MDTDHFPQHQPRVHRRTVGSGKLNALGQSTFKIHRAFCNAGGVNQLAGRWREPGKAKFIPIVGKHRGGLIHRMREIARCQVPDKLPGFHNITHAVLPAVAGKADDRRAVVKAAEETVRCKVQLTGLVARGDPAYRTWTNNGVQRVMRQAVSLRRLIEVHNSLSLVGNARVQDTQRNVFRQE